ncbi:hypothetical protein HK100_000079 [Physocladia obscura]|uniref:alpha-D-xyloside xylohydrolase n=1 Tax=Physocladia obscura TaxID=109957 RepID=A0AAD5T4U9_9FUNG|nr:hypothetical protein HK100_000079 [Physocladia obscura]
MKFTDGMWLAAPGFQNVYPAEAYYITPNETEGSFNIYAPVNRINHRGDTLSGPVITIELSSPQPGIIKVNACHFSGGGPPIPAFQIHKTSDYKPIIKIDQDFATLIAGSVTARFSVKGAWSLEFLDSDTGAIISRSEPRGLGYSKTDTGEAYIYDQLTLDVGELVYGLGERFNALIKNGQSIDMWNRDGGAGSDQAYKSIPFYLTNRGYGVFVNHPGKVEYEVCTEKASKVQFSVPGEEIEYYFIYGKNPKGVLSKYTDLTGKPALPPAWTFGLWLTTSFTTSYDEKTVTSFLDGMAERKIPLHVFHFDCFWMKGFQWMDFEWDPETFPDPKAMIARYHQRGLRVCAWINSYVSQRSKLFEEGKAAGYFIKKSNGHVWQSDLWQPGMGIVDFTNPAAREWYQSHLNNLMDTGIDAFKTDFGERIPHENVRYHDGSDPEKMHNYYTYLYNKTVFDCLTERKGEGEAVLFARSATAGGQQFPVHWGGDCWSNFNAMAESLRGGLSLCLSGFGFWSHDIGGFEGKPPASLYKRWVVFGILSTHSRLHGSSSYRVPWLYDDEACDVLRFFIELKCELMPYFFAKAVETHKTGIPMLRALLLEFPHDPAVFSLDKQYLLGDSLLVAPILHEDNHVDYYVPEGRWTNYITGAVVEGPRWVREIHGFMTVPLLVRPNSIIAVGANNQKPDYDYADGVTIKLYELSDAATAAAVIPNLKGETKLTVTARREKKTITITAEGNAQSWKVLLVGFQSLKAVKGIVSIVKRDNGIELLPKAGILEFSVETWA